jgi:hypothetical protein
MQFELTVTALQQRAIAIALALLPAAGIVAVLYVFVAGQIDHHSRVAMLVRELAREHALITQSQDWEARLLNIRAAPPWQRLFVGYNRQSGAAAQLINNAGAKVERSSVARLDSKGAAELDETVLFTADIGKLSQILAQLRKTQPLFVIRRLSIRDAEPSSITPRTVPNALHIELTVAEFARP